MAKFITEPVVEEAALEILQELGYEVAYGPDIAFDGPHPERRSYGDVVLVERLKAAVDRLNPHLPPEAREDMIRKILRAESRDLLTNNEKFHEYRVEGIPVEYRKDGRIKHDTA